MKIVALEYNREYKKIHNRPHYKLRKLLLNKLDAQDKIHASLLSVVRFFEVNGWTIDVRLVHWIGYIRFALQHFYAKKIHNSISALNCRALMRQYMETPVVKIVDEVDWKANRDNRTIPKDNEEPLINADAQMLARLIMGDASRYEEIGRFVDDVADSAPLDEPSTGDDFDDDDDIVFV